MTDEKPIRVLIVAPGMPLVGGQTVQAQRLFEKFRAEPQLVIDFQAINPVFFPNLQKIKYVRTFLTTIKYIFDLLTKIPRNDVIHIFSASYFSFLLAPTPALLIAKLFGKKTILNYRSGEAEDHLTRWKTAIPIVRLFDRIITPSHYLVDVFAKFGLEAHSIFNFVDAEKYVFRERSPVKPIFLSNRNFEELYNVSCVLRSFALIQKEFPDAKLIVAGDGSEKEKLHELAKELELQNVEFLGRVSQDEMPKLYERAGIYLNSPNIDNMPNSIIEAFASGTLVISTNAGGIPYIVTDKENGILVDIDDHKAMAKQAIFLLEQGEIAKRIADSAHCESEKYYWKNVESHWLSLYSELSTI